MLAVVAETTTSTGERAQNTSRSATQGGGRKNRPGGVRNAERRSRDPIEVPFALS